MTTLAGIATRRSSQKPRKLATASSSIPHQRPSNNGRFDLKASSTARSAAVPSASTTSSSQRERVAVLGRRGDYSGISGARVELDPNPRCFEPEDAGPCARRKCRGEPHREPLLLPRLDRAPCREASTAPMTSPGPMLASAQSLGPGSPARCQAAPGGSQRRCPRRAGFEVLGKEGALVLDLADPIFGGQQRVAQLVGLSHSKAKPSREGCILTGAIEAGVDLIQIDHPGGFALSGADLRGASPPTRETLPAAGSAPLVPAQTITSGASESAGPANRSPWR